MKMRIKFDNGKAGELLECFISAIKLSLKAIKKTILTGQYC
jgi:hypothetical protein